MQPRRPPARRTPGRPPGRQDGLDGGPRLRTERCFLRLDPRTLGGKLAQAATIKGATALGVPVVPNAIGRIDLIVAGSVAVHPTGARLGKGGGYSDLEFALARARWAWSTTTHRS